METTTATPSPAAFWSNFLATDNHTPIKEARAAQLAFNWTTCAVGEISQQFFNKPLFLWDTSFALRHASLRREILELGYIFPDAIKDRDWPTARLIYEKIEAKMRLLKAEEVLERAKGVNTEMTLAELASPI